MATVDLWHDGIRGNAAAMNGRTPAPPPAAPAPAPAPPLERRPTFAPTPGRTGGPTYTTNTPGVPPVIAPAPSPSNAGANGDAGYYTNWGGGNVAQQQQQMNDVLHGGGAPMQGYVAGKVQNTALGTSHKYVGGRILAAGGSIDDVLHTPEFAGWTKVGSDKIRGPEGSVYDVRNANGAVQWTAISGPAWDRNGIPGVNSLGVSSAMAHDGIRGNYAAANGAAAAQARANGTSTFGYAPTPGAAPGQSSSYPSAPPPVPLPGSGLPPGDPGSIQSSYTAQFSDPSTHQFEQYLMQQMQALEAQRDAQGKANAGLAGQQQQANLSSQQLVDYLRQRSQQLQAPAYTGSEAEVMRTQALDPIERDRTAANQRVLQNIGSRGFDPTSGIAQQLMGDVNQGYDQQRAAAQGDLAYRQITEQRSRQQEAQSLLAAIPQVQSGSAQQQLQFMQALDAALNKPREQGINLSQMLYRLPAQAQSDALQAMGAGPSGDSMFSQAMGLYNAQNQQQQQGAQWYQMLGSMLPYLLGN